MLKLKLSLYSLLLLLLFGCQKSNNSMVEYEGKRENVIVPKTVSIADELPDMHSFSHLYIIGDTLVINDHKSTTFQFAAYDIAKEKYICSFGKFGNGPGEIANFGSIYINPEKRKLIGTDLNKFRVVGFQLDSALSDTAYVPQIMGKLRSENGVISVMLSSNFVNDTTAYCEMNTPTERRDVPLVSSLGKYNPYEGKMTEITAVSDDERERYCVAVSLKDSLIYAFGRNNDVVTLLDLEGNRIKTIIGPDNIEKPGGRLLFYTWPVVGGNHVFVVYSGKELRDRPNNNDIHVLTLDGRYELTFRLDDQIAGLAYHEPTNRLYFSTEGEPQFGYISLDDYLVNK